MVRQGIVPWRPWDRRESGGKHLAEQDLEMNGLCPAI